MVLYYVFNPDLDPTADRYKLFPDARSYFSAGDEDWIMAYAKKVNSPEVVESMLVKFPLNDEITGILRQLIGQFPQRSGEWYSFAVVYAYIAGSHERRYLLHYLKRCLAGGSPDYIFFDPERYKDKKELCEELFEKIMVWLENPDAYPEHITPITKGIEGYVSGTRVRNR